MFVDPAVTQVGQETQCEHEDPADDDHSGEGIPYLEQVDLLTQENGVFEDGEEEADQNEESVSDQDVGQLDLAGVDGTDKVKGETKLEKDVGGQKHGNVFPVGVCEFGYLLILIGTVSRTASWQSSSLTEWH